MTTFTRLTSLFLISCLINACAANNRDRSIHVPSLQNYDDAPFLKEKALVIARDESANFDLLRSSYTRSSSYQPWESREHQAGLALLDANEEGNFELCTTLAEAMLNVNYTSLLGHFGGAACNAALGRAEQSEFHAWVLQGLIDSIRFSGDGLSVDSPFVCNSPTEMRDFVRMLGLLMYRQEYAETGVKQIERVYAVVSETDENIILYFDTTAARMHSFYTENHSDDE